VPRGFAALQRELEGEEVGPDRGVGLLRGRASTTISPSPRLVPRNLSSSTPLMMIPFRKRPSAAWICSSAETFMPPPDWPKIVTFAGEPPKAAMFSCTHRRAATRSAIPALPEFSYLSANGARSRYPRIFSR